MPLLFLPLLSAAAAAAVGSTTSSADQCPTPENKDFSVAAVTVASADFALAVAATEPLALDGNNLDLY